MKTSSIAAFIVTATMLGSMASASFDLVKKVKANKTYLQCLTSHENSKGIIKLAPARAACNYILEDI